MRADACKNKIIYFIIFRYLIYNSYLLVYWKEDGVAVCVFEHSLLWCKWWPFTQTQDAFDKTQFLMAFSRCLQVQVHAGACHSWKMHANGFLQIASAAGNSRNVTMTIDGMLTSLQWLPVRLAKLYRSALSSLVDKHSW